MKDRLPIAIIKIEPEKQIVAKLVIRPSISQIRKLLRIPADNCGWRRLISDVNGSGEDLMVASRTEIDRDKPTKEWRFRGSDNTAGIGILYGTLNGVHDGMWHAPVDVAWVRSRIVWCEPGEVAPAAEVAAALGIEGATPEGI